MLGRWPISTIHINVKILVMHKGRRIKITTYVQIAGDISDRTANVQI